MQGHPNLALAANGRVAATRFEFAAREIEAGSRWHDCCFDVGRGAVCRRL